MSKFGAAFLLLLVIGSLYAIVQPRDIPATVQDGPRVAANRRLTALNGALLLLLLMAVAITIIFIRSLLLAHFLVGFALIPPLLLKLFTTGQRFVRYYAGDHDFRRAGAPPLFLRFVVAPVLIASTAAVMGTGIELWLFGARFGSWWVSAHTFSAVAFMGAVFVHMLSHFRVSARVVAEEAGAPNSPGSSTRRSVIIACVILAGVLAAASLTYATPFGLNGGGG